jgi:hypothetical protein
MSGCVYFVEATGLGRIKIGFARARLAHRLESLRNASPVELMLLGHIPGRRALESTIHRRFAHLRVHREWFEAAPELRDYIRARATPGLYGPSGRGTVRVMLSLPPDALAELEALAARLAGPGLPPNRSAAAREIVRTYLAAPVESRRRKS